MHYMLLNLMDERFCFQGVFADIALSWPKMYLCNI